MANRTETNTARKVEKNLKSLSKTAAASTRPQTTDEIILTLSAAYENKRAQQVSEWQSLQPMVMRRAA